MQQLHLTEARQQSMYGTTSRDVVAVFFRRRRLLMAVFAVVFVSGLAIAFLLLANNYESEAKILVSRERQDPALSSDAKVAYIGPKGVSDEDVSSEIELITSVDLLEKVVRQCQLYKIVTPLGRLADIFRDTSDTARIARAIEKLQHKLTVSPISGSNLIRLGYQSSDPRRSANVIRTLTELYLEKHTQVHRPTGVYQFFQKEAEHYKDELQQAQNQISDFARKQDTASAQAERDSAVQKATEMELMLRTTEASMAETGKRIRSLSSQLGSTQARLVTSDRNDDSVLLAQLKSTLVNLELKRTELLTKYEPTYVIVGEVDKQIVQTQQAIATEERAPIRTVTTDRNPTAQLLNNDLAKAQADLAALEAKHAALVVVTQKYRNEAQVYLDKSIAQQDLLRSAKVAEDNYLLYTSKREEARIADALDQRRMVNVAVAEPATLPYLPVLSMPLLILAAFILACVASLSTGFASHYLDTSLHSPKEIEAYIELPLLAAVPAAKHSLLRLGSRKAPLTAMGVTSGSCRNGDA